MGFVVRLWNTLMQSAKAGTSGYQSQDEFNNDLYAVQISLLTLLGPLYAKNIQIQDLLSPFVKETAIGTVKPTDYFQFVSSEVNGNPSYPINPNQVSIYKTSPIRKPTIDNNLSYYYFVDNTVKFLTASGTAGTMIYIRKPNEASIVLNQVSTEDSDYVTPVVGQELEWPETAFNLILYMMMQRLGVEMKESILIEMSNFGIQMEASKL